MPQISELYDLGMDGETATARCAATVLGGRT